MDSEQIHERAIAASKEVLQRMPLDSMGPSKAAIGAVLTTLAGAGLMDFNFLDSSTRVSSGDLRQAAATIETLASQSGSLASIYLVNAIMAGSCVAAAGTVEQRNEILPQLRDGSLQIAFALTEPEAGSDAASLATTAERDGGDGFRLTGEKLFATGAVLKKMARTTLEHAFIEGQSLWKDGRQLRTLSVCQPARQNPISTDCRRYLEANAKARLQWDLQAALTNFETNISRKAQLFRR